MYIAARDEGAVRTVDLTTNTVVRTATVAGGQIQNVAVSLDGGSLYGTDIGRSKLITWDLTSAGSGYVETDVGTPGFRNVFDVAVTPDNAQLYVSTLSAWSQAAAGVTSASMALAATRSSRTSRGG